MRCARSNITVLIEKFMLMSSVEILVTVADHDRALVGLTQRGNRIVHERLQALSDDNLSTAIELHRRAETDHGCKSRIGVARGKHDFSHLNFALRRQDLEHAAIVIDVFNAMAWPVTDSQPLVRNVKRAK